MLKRALSLLFALLLPLLSMAEELRLAVDASTEMPWAEIRQDKLVDGIHLALGQALAARMGRSAKFLVLPRQRLAYALERGEADLACVFMPEWMPGPFDWTVGFIDDADIVLSLRSSVQPRRIDDLAGIPLGTIIGFRYPELEQRLGPRFIRDDAPNATSNLLKLEHGRLSHVITNERLVLYRQRLGQLTLPLHPPLVISRHRAGCAVSRHGQVSAAEVSDIIGQLERNGSIEQLLNKFR